MRCKLFKRDITKSSYQSFVDELDNHGLVHEFYLNMKQYQNTKMKVVEAVNLKYLMERIIKFVKDKSFVEKVRVSLETLKVELAAVLDVGQSSSGSLILLGANGFPA